MKNNNTTDIIVKNAIIAAAYMALTYIFASVSYGIIQFRVSEVLNLLIWYNPMYMPGVVLGCAIANLASPFGVIDIVVGTLHTLVSLYAMSKIDNRILASMMPAFFSFIIGLEVAYLEGMAVFIPTTISVFLSELVICSLVSLPLYRTLEENSYIRSNVFSYRLSSRK